MVNFGLLPAEIGPVVWRTPANLKGFHVSAVTARQSSIGRQPNYAELNRGCHLYLAGMPEYREYVCLNVNLIVNRYY